MTGKVLLPILGDAYGATLERGELRVECVDGAWVLRHGDRDLPLHVSPGEDLSAIDGEAGTPASFDRLHGLLERWIPRLDERADAWLVVQRNLGSDSLQRWLAATFERGYSVHRAATARGFRVIRVRRHGSPRSEPIDLP